MYVYMYVRMYTCMYVCKYTHMYSMYVQWNLSNPASNGERKIVVEFRIRQVLFYGKVVRA